MRKMEVDTKKFHFLTLKFRLQVSFWRAPTHADVIEFSDFLLQLKSQRSGSKTVGLFCLLF